MVPDPCRGDARVARNQPRVLGRYGLAESPLAALQ